MAIPQLTPEQVQNWTREQKDTWWLKNVFRGNMPQLTLRSALTGFVLGGLLSLTNLYIGAKTGWTLGVGLTSVILAFATFKAISAIGLGKEFTILENNAMQSIATSAGYMTGPLISGLAAYMMVENRLLPWHQMMLFNVVLSVLGVLVAFPMKRRFINDEQAPFPEGAACGVVLDTLYTSDARVGLFKAKALVAAASLAALLKFISGKNYQIWIQTRLMGRKTYIMMSEHLDAWYYKLVAAGRVPAPKLGGVQIDKLGLSPTLDLAMFGAGGLMNIRYAVNMFCGMIAAYCFAAPIAVAREWVIKKGAILAPDAVANRNDVLLGWILWPGVAMLVCASLASFFAKPQVIISAFTTVFAKKGSAAAQGRDVLKHIELPLWISFIGVPIVGAIGVWMAHEWFEVKWFHGALAIPLIIVLTLIAVNATAATSITPTGSLSKITQLTFGILNPRHPGTNLMTATMTTEVASNAANLLMDIKPGYMLGAKPRQQALGHCIGILAGAIFSTPMFFIMFLAGHPGNSFTAEQASQAGKTVQERLIEGDRFTGALQWKGISDFIAGLTGDAGLSTIIHPTALRAMGIAAVLGVVLELVRVFSKNKFLFSPVAFALGVVIPPDSTLWMFLGSAFFYFMSGAYKSRQGTFGHHLWCQTKEPVCAGLIAGAALTGIGDTLVEAFLLG